MAFPLWLAFFRLAPPAGRGQIASPDAIWVRGLSTSPPSQFTASSPLSPILARTNRFPPGFSPFPLSQNRKNRPPHPFQTSSALVHTARTRRPFGPRVAFSGSLLGRSIGALAALTSPVSPEVSQEGAQRLIA